MNGNRPFLSQRKVVRALALLAASGALLYLGGLLWFGFADVLTALERIGIVAVLAGSLLTLLTILVRFLRWRALLHAMGYEVGWWYNFRVYLSGIALTASPGKLGETFRTVLLLPCGVRAASSLGAFLADRMSDVIGVALLGALAARAAGGRAAVLEVLVLLAVAGSFAAAWAFSHPRTLGRLEALPRAKRLVRWVRSILSPALEWARVWSFRRVPLYVSIAVVAYGLQALFFAALVARVSPVPGTVECIAIFASSTLLGAASGIPAGLGAMEAALMYQLISAGLDPAAATAVAIAVRACTLWFGVLVGTLTLLGFSRGSAAHETAGG